jgi:hypothetical protein
MLQPRFLILAILLGAGCSAPPAKPAHRASTAPANTSVAPLSNTDPCAMRLHDICGPLLLYYATNHHLPPALDDLRAVPGFESVRDFTCPVSQKPYIYNPAGLPAPVSGSRLILYDPEPSHAGMRWAISIIESQNDGPLIAKVMALPETYFAK